MPWLFPWSDSIKKRVCRYLLQRYLGQFLKEKLTLEQLNIDIYGGTGEIRDILLDVNALNDVGAANNLPLEFVDGYIREVHFNVPWSALLTTSCYVEISGLMLTVHAKQMLDDAAMFDSMLDSMSTSTIDMAKECLGQSEQRIDGSGETLEGIEALAGAIDSVLLRIKVRFLDTTLRVEHVGQDEERGVSIEMKIASMDYMDEAGGEVAGRPQCAPPPPAVVSVKRLSMDGVTLHGGQFLAGDRAVPGSMAASFSEDREDESRTSSPPPGSDTIQLGQLNGRTELRCEVKVNDAIPGPKLSIQLTSGSLCLLLGPRQLHDLVQLLSGVIDPRRVENSAPHPTARGRQTEKPMTPSDYQVIEDQLLRRSLGARHQLTTQALQAQGWSSNVLEEDDDEFLPFVRPHAAMSASITSTATSADLEASMASSATGSLFSDTTSTHRSDLSYTRPRPRRRRDRMHDDEQSEDVIRLHAQLNTVCVILLHDDVLTAAPDTQLLTPASVKQMQRLVESGLGRLSAVAVGGGGVITTRPDLLEACPHSHLSLVAAPVKFECSERPSDGRKSVFSMTLTAGVAELLECLVDRKTSVSPPSATYTELLTFETGEPPPTRSDEAPGDTAISLTVRRCQFVVNRHTTNTAVNVRLRLAPCRSEVDVSLTDRLSTLLSPAATDHAHCMTSPGNGEHADTKQQCFNEAMDDAASGAESKVDVQINMPLIDIRLRFPIPDLRPPCDMARQLWWRRNVHPDSMHVRLSDASLRTTMGPRDEATRLELQARAVAVSYRETEAPSRVTFLNVSSGGGSDCLLADGAVALDWPRAVITMWPVRRAPLLETDERASPVHESSSPFGGLSAAACQREPSPFGRRRVIYGTDSHWRGQPDLASEGEELVIPALQEDVDEFIDHTVSNCQVLVELTLPLVRAILPDKRFYELIYNRLATDMALWEPSAPGTSNPETTHTQDPLSLLADPFQMCKSANQYDSDSDASVDVMYQSVYEQQHSQRRRQRQEDDLVRSRQSRLCVRLQLQQACLAVQTPCLTEDGTPVPGHHGEVQVVVDTGSLFIASGYGGLYGHGYICMSAHRASLYHKGQMPTRAVPVLPSPDLIPPCLDRLIRSYGQNGTPPSGDMFSVAVKYQLDETNNIKTFTVAVGVDGCSLRHLMLPTRQLFVSQLMNMFDVVDFPVAGYDMPATVTQLHVQVTRSALDYRPLHLPYQYLVTLDSFMLSSHLAAATGTSVLRFILEDAALHVANRSGAQLVSARDYVCLVDAGLLELSIRTSDTPADGQPHLDWRFSNNSINVRTCADSLHALIQLVTYLASEGDLGEQGGRGESPAPAAAPRVSVRQAAGEQALLADLLEDAMQETSPPAPARTAATQGPVEVFFFPNEPHVTSPPAQMATAAEPSNTVMATMVEALADIDDQFEDADEEFCVLDDDPGSGIQSRSGEPQVRILTTETVRIIDDFLPVPLCRADVLRAPEHFPVPHVRYTVQQMSLSWSMFGGNDLATSSTDPAARKVRIASPAASPPDSPRARPPDSASSSGSSLGVTFNRHGPRKVRFGTMPPPDASAPSRSAALMEKHRGGPGRRTDELMELRLTKVRASWEEYPENTEEASRLVLVINDVEMLDKIATSDINKFLYQYVSEKCPRQAHSNMVLLKALNRRPDPTVPTEETDVRVSLCPIRLNVDQDALFFLRDFFREVTGYHGGGVGCGAARGGPSTSAASDAPVLSITQNDPPLGQDDVEPDEGEDELPDDPALGAHRSNDASQIYFRTFTFSPEVLIRIDYQGKRVDIGQFGPLIGLIIGLGQLNCSEIRLIRISHKSGLLGLDRLLHHALNEWLTDIRRNQLPSLLGGIGPLHSFVQLFQGIRDLLWLPIEQYQKDGRIVKGLQRGANSFSTSTAMAFLELTNRLVCYIQSASEFAYDMVSPGPSVREKRGKKRSRRGTSNLPQDLREGVTNAYELVKEGLGETAQTLARVAAEEHDQKGVSGAVGGVVRQIPATMVKPIVVISEATSNVLGGMRNQLAPDARQESLDKWKSSSEHHLGGRGGLAAAGFGSGEAISSVAAARLVPGLVRW